MNKAIWRAILLAGLLSSSLLACAAPPADTPRAELEAAIQRWVEAVNAQDTATLAATMTEDVELTDDAGTVTGRDAAIRALRGAAGNGKLVTTTREITISSDDAWHTVGIARVLKNGDVQAIGEAMENWKRIHGVWRLHARKLTAVDPEVSVTRPTTKEPVLDH